MTTKRLRFSDQAIDRLRPPTAGRDTYHDTEVRGLQLRVSTSGVKSFSLYRWFKGAGRPDRVTLGTFPDMGAAQARRKAEALNGEIAEGVNPAEAKRQLRGEPTLDEVFTDFLQRRQNRRGAYLSEVTKRGYTYDFNLHLATLKSRKLSRIDEGEVRRLHARLGRDHPTSANRVVAMLSSLYGYATATGQYGGGNPTKGIQRFPESKRNRWLQPDEIPAFLAAVLAEPDQDARDLVMFSLFTGARQNNVTTARWEGINTQRAVWTMPTTKNGEPLTVPLVPDALAIIAGRTPKVGNPYLFPASHGDSHVTQPKRQWARILRRAEGLRLLELMAEREGWMVRQRRDEERAWVSELTVGRAQGGYDAALVRLRERAQKAGLERDKVAAAAELSGLRLHDLRRTLGSWQARTGSSLIVIGKTLGHRNPKSTAIYAHLDLDPVRTSVVAATDAIMAHGRMAKPLRRKA